MPRTPTASRGSPSSCWPPASTAPQLSTPRRGRMLVEREATHRAIALAELVDLPILIVHVSGREAVEQIRWAQARGLQRLWRDLPAVPVPDRRRSRRARLRGREVHLQPAAARQGEPGGASGTGSRAACSRSFSSDHAPFRYEGPTASGSRGEDAAFNQVPERHPRPRDAPAAAV